MVDPLLFHAESFKPNGVGSFEQSVLLTVTSTDVAEGVY